MFLNREDELAFLRSRWDSGQGEFLVIYGRRRVGKSHLLAHFAESRNSFIFEASSGSAKDNLSDISRELASFTGSQVIEAQEFNSWRAVFAALDDLAASEKVLIVLDEFQYIARQDQAVGSLLNRITEKNHDNPNFKLVISGSDVSFFAESVMGYGATSYGRRTGSLHLQPFRFQHAKEFMPGFSIEDQIRAYSVFGGMPYYLEDISGSDSLAGTIYDLVLATGAKLAEEPDFLLAQESKIRERDSYKSVLRAIANGKTKPGEISARIGKDVPNTINYLNSLDDIGLIAKNVKVSEATPGRKDTWAVKDPFLRFWFQFVGPYESRLITDKRSQQHLEETILPNLDQFVSLPGFETICRQWTEDQYDVAASVGGWWGSIKQQMNGQRRNRHYEADVAGIDGTGELVLLGSCKWTEQKHPVAELKKLETIRDLEFKASDVTLLFFSRGTVDRGLAEAAGTNDLIRLVDIGEL